MRKSIIKVITAALLIAVFAQGASAADETPILKDLITRAEGNNSLISAEHERVIRAEEAIKEAQAKMGPKAVAAYGALWQSDALVNLPSSLSRLTNSLGVDISPLDSKELYAAAIGLVQSIYNGGTLKASKEAAKFSRDAYVSEESRVRQGVDNSVRLAYYNEKRAEAKENVAREALSLAQDHLKRSEKLFSGGVIAYSDVLRTKVAVSDARLNLIKASNGIQLALTALERAVGSPVTANDIKGNAITGKEKNLMHSFVTSASSGDVDLAYQYRPEINMYTMLSKQAEQLARAAKGQLLPQILAAGLVSNIDDSVLPGGDTEWRAAIGAYWTIYDGGQIKAKTEQAKAMARELLYRLEDLKKSIKMDVTQAQLNLKAAMSRLEVAQRQVAESEEDYRIAVKRYNANVGTNLDMLDARVSLINSRTQLIDAAYDIQIAKADLIYAIGQE